MGKTTVCNEIAKRWGNETNVNYELVFLLCLHIPSVKNIDSFNSLFEVVCPGDQKNFLQHILHHLNHTRGKNVLVIFDGFDELFDEQGTPSSSYLLNIVYRKLLQLQLCDMVISSRHPASVQLYQRSDCARVEILGFSDELKLNYIQQNNAGELCLSLQGNASLNSISYHPLLLVNIISFYKAQKFPDFETAVIDKLVCSLIIWSVKLPQTQHHLSVTALYEKLSFQDQLKLVSKLAYTAYDSDTKLQKFKESVYEDLNVSGLGFIKPYILSHTSDVFFTFIHYSIQQFLVAFYLKISSKTEQKHFWEKNMWVLKYLDVWFYYCGMIRKDDNIIITSLSDNFLDSLFFRVKGTSEVLQDKIKCLYLMYCFMQSPDNPLYKQVKSKVIIDENIMDISQCTIKIDGFEMVRLFLCRYTLKHWRCLSFTKCGIDENLLIGLSEAFKHLSRGTVCIDVLDLSDNNIITLNQKSFSALIKICNVSQCILSHNKIDDEEIFNTILSFSQDHLCNTDDYQPKSFINHDTLFLFYTSPLRYLGNNIKSSSCLLVKLHIIRCKLTSDVVSFFCEALKQHFTILLLSFYDNRLLKDDIFKLVSVIKDLTKISGVLVYEKSLSDKDADDLYHILTATCCIAQVMVVSATKIQAFRASSHQITLAVTYINSFVDLQLRECHITYETIAKLATLMNKSCFSHNNVNLYGCSVNDSDLDMLCEKLDPEVTVLSLSLPASISSTTLAKMICCVRPLTINISGSLTDGNKQSVGMVVAENLFATQKQSTVMLTCDDEKVVFSTN